MSTGLHPARFRWLAWLMISFPTSSSPAASDTSRTDRNGSATDQAAPTRRSPAPGGLLSRRERAASFPPYSSAPSARHLDDLDDLYGPSRAPRAKPGQSAIQWQELAEDGTVVVHPRRTEFSWGTPSDDDKLKMQQARASVEGGRPHKWMIDSQGALVVGPTKVTGEEWPPAKSGLPRANSLGHVTLIGGSKAPSGRIGGEWYREKPEDAAGNEKPEDAAGNEGELVIDNNSGRYSEFTHLEPRHLENVAARFKQLGCPVVPRWIDMQARGEQRKAMKAALAAAAAAEAPALPGVAATNDRH